MKISFFPNPFVWYKNRQAQKREQEAGAIAEELLKIMDELKPLIPKLVEEINQPAWIKALLLDLPENFVRIAMNNGNQLHSKHRELRSRINILSNRLKRIQAHPTN